MENEIELTDEQKKIIEVKQKIDDILQESGMLMSVDHLIRIIKRPE